MACGVAQKCSRAARTVARDRELHAAVWQALKVAGSTPLLAVSDGIVCKVNAALVRLCGCTSEELLGKRVNPDLIEETQRRRGRQSQRWRAVLKTAVGEIPVEVVRQKVGGGRNPIAIYSVCDLRKAAEVLAPGDGQVMAVAQAEPPGLASNDVGISERERLSEQLQAALNNMAQGLAMFDAQQRLVICNRLFAEMYRLAAEQVRPGLTIQEIVRARIDAGVYGEVDSEI
jgi:PAS domain-containing protein